MKKKKSIGRLEEVVKGIYQKVEKESKNKKLRSEPQKDTHTIIKTIDTKREKKTIG